MHKSTAAALARKRTERWSKALIGAGFALLVASWIMEGRFAFETGDRSMTLFGLPVDALGKTALAVVTGFVGFAGAAVTAWLFRQEGVKAKRQARLALAITAAACAVSMFNLASYFGYARRLVEFPVIAASVEYAQARTDHATASARLAGEPLGYEEEGVVRETQKRAAAILRNGQRPTGSELPGWVDLIRAFIAHGLIVGMAAAFRLPDPVKRKSRSKRRGASVTVFEGGRSAQR